MNDIWAVGVDLGGTKLEVGRVDANGTIVDSIRMATKVEEGPAVIIRDIAKAVDVLVRRAGRPPIGIGVGMAGQIDRQTGTVHFAPNLDWHEVPLRSDLEHLLGMNAVVINDVRAIMWGEWHHGAGRGYDDIVCLFVGTGIGGGVVSGGRVMEGCSNSAGELGHITVDLNGPPCTCGNSGCFEALAGGWAIARRARQIISRDPVAGQMLLDAAGGLLEEVTARTVAVSAYRGDRTALSILDDVGRALIAGCISLVNAFNPCRLILGGGVIYGMPELIDRVRHGVRQCALAAANRSLEIVPGELGSAAGIVGSASLALQTFRSQDTPVGR